MAEPVVFISHFRVKEGKLDGLRRLQRDATQALEAEKPRTVLFLVYLDDGGRQMTVVHVFADADSMDLHFEGAEERSKLAYEFLEPRGWEIYGRPSEAALEALRRAAASAGVTLSVEAEYSGGFLRLSTT
jgi:quinol monooxygenase YgiN